MKLASMLKVRPWQIAAVGIAMIALGGAPAFADTPFHGARDPQASPWHQQAAPQGRDQGCDARGQWNQRGRRADHGCTMRPLHRGNRFDQHRTAR